MADGRVNAAGQQKPTEALSEDGRKAWRVAAILIVCNVTLSAAVAFTTKDTGGGAIGWIVALVLAYNLYHHRAGTGTAVLVLSGLGALIFPILYFRRDPTLSAVILTLATWGFAAALFLLLVGEPKRPRRIAAVVTFGVLRGGVAALAIVATLIRKQ